MSKRVHVEIVYFDDWTRMLVDGEVYHEDHSIPDFVWIQLFGKLAPRVEFHKREATKAEVVDVVGYDPEVGP